VFVGHRLYVFYEGVTSFDARNGKERLREKYRVNEEGLALTEAEPIFADNMIYVSGHGRLPSRGSFGPVLDRIDPATQLDRLSHFFWHRQRLATLRGQWIYFYTPISTPATATDLPASTSTTATPNGKFNSPISTIASSSTKSSASCTSPTATSYSVTG
jgi:hypothetical protein